MGTNYNTGIIYGYDLGDLTDQETYESWAPAWMLDDDGSIDDWDPDEHLAKKLGWTPLPFPNHAVVTAPDRYGYPQQRMDAEHPDYIAYNANRDQRTEILKAADYGCSLDSYGHSEGDLTLLVKVDASKIRSNIWTPKLLDLSHMGAAPLAAWDGMLERYLDALDIPRDRAGEPGWFLIGSVG